MATESFTLFCLRSLVGDDVIARDAATAQLCEQFEPLACKMAKRYCQWLEQREELEQVARLGLVEACRTFDLTRWKKHKNGAEHLFARHATWCVRHALAEHLANEPNPVRLPSTVIRRLPKLRRVIVQLSHQLGREPTFEEIVATEVIPKATHKDTASIIIHMLAYDTMQIPAEDEMAAETLTPEEILLAKETQHELERQR